MGGSLGKNCLVMLPKMTGIKILLKFTGNALGGKNPVGPAGDYNVFMLLSVFALFKWLSIQPEIQTSIEMRFPFH